MSVHRIDDIGDPRLTPYRNLRGTAGPQGCFIAEGRMPVRRLIRSKHSVSSVLVPRGVEGEFQCEVPDGTPIYSLPSPRLKELVGFDFHRGVIACGIRPKLPPSDQLRFDSDDGTEKAAGLPLALSLIGVAELENVGSILRSAAAMGVRHVLMGPGTADPFARRVIRVSMANVFSLNLYTLTDPAAEIECLAARLNMRTVAATLSSDACHLEDFVPDDRPMMLMVGNEAVGLPAESVAAATEQVTIPMELGTDSLNVAVATAIFLYRMTRPTCPQSRQ